MKRYLFVLALLFPVPAAANSITCAGGTQVCENVLIPGHPGELTLDTNPDPPQTAEEYLADLQHEPPPPEDVPDMWVLICRWIPYPPIPSPEEGASPEEGGSPTEGEGFPSEGQPAEGGPSEGEGTVPEPSIIALMAVSLAALRVKGWKR